MPAIRKVKRRNSKSSARVKRTCSRSRPRAARGRRIIIQTQPPVEIPNYKTCAEPEVGDIGGFGDVNAFESHEKVCGDKATEYCATCSRDLCMNHYEILHKEHDSGGHKITNRPAML